MSLCRCSTSQLLYGFCRGATLTHACWNFRNSNNAQCISIIKVKDKYQLTLPAGLREEAGIEVGDIVDAEWDKGKITLTPKLVVDRIPQALKDVRAEAKRKGLNKITMDEIDAEVAAGRIDRRGKKSPTNRRSS